jgi:hypothetical protein
MADPIAGGAHMTTRLDKPIKRELELEGRLYTITISPEGVKVVEKGKRLGHELSWHEIVNGDAALARDLKISLDAAAM